MDSDGPSSPVAGTQGQSKSVSFARPLEDYADNVDELMEVSSSESDPIWHTEDDDRFFSANQEVHANNNDRGLLKSSYLERNDFKALLESLRTMEQQDTAYHLMSVAMLDDGPQNDDKLRPRKPLRKGWTAWPVPPDQTRHSVNADAELREEFKAALHATITQKLRAQGDAVSADELPEPVSDAVVDVMLTKFMTLIEKIGCSRTYQGGVAQSTSKRLGLMNHTHVVSILEHSQITTPEVISRVLKRCEGLFGESRVFECQKRPNEYQSKVKREEVVQEVAAGPGKWHLRGTKRQKRLSDEDHHIATSETTRGLFSDTQLQNGADSR